MQEAYCREKLGMKMVYTHIIYSSLLLETDSGANNFSTLPDCVHKPELFNGKTRQLGPSLLLPFKEGPVEVSKVGQKCDLVSDTHQASGSNGHVHVHSHRDAHII